MTLRDTLMAEEAEAEALRAARHIGSGHHGAAGLIWACAVVTHSRAESQVGASAPARFPFAAPGVKPAVAPAQRPRVDAAAEPFCNRCGWPADPLCPSRFCPFRKAA